MQSVPRILIAAVKSGSGKTLITCGIMKALKDRGLVVRGIKCGPDFIDPMFHETVLGIRSRNLDGFLMTRAQMTDSLLRHSRGADLTVAEGVMGYYDGIGGTTEEASSYETAAVTKTPVLLVVDAGGCGISVVPVIRGMMEFRKDAGIAGVILNNAAGGIVRSLSDLIQKETGIPVVGSLERNPAYVIGSRHLGLMLPGEVKDLEERLALLSADIAERFDLSRILEIAGDAPPLEGSGTTASPSSPFAAVPADSGAAEPSVRIAAARDEAFCFMYPDNLELLRDMGAEIVFFSPVHDRKIPDGSGGMLLPGGYPELYAKELSENASMRESVRRAITSGMPVMAECGGFLYLHETIRDPEGTDYPMAGAFSGEAWYQGKTGRFGYISVTDPESRSVIKAHEFHAYESSDPGSVFTAVKPFSGRSWPCMHRRDGGLWGFPHLYYPSAPEVAEDFLQAARRYGRSGRKLSAGGAEIRGKAAGE